MREQIARDLLRSQSDMFVRDSVIPKETSPFSYFYKYRDGDGEHIGTCQDWETEATFLRRRSRLGEAEALLSMVQTFGVEYPTKGMALAHRYRSEQWLINGVVRLSPVDQLSLI